MQSMTGFGRGVADGVGGRIAIEVRSVNHRFLDLKLRGAPSAAIEDLITARVRDRLERGAVTVAVRLERGAGASGAQLDPIAARRAHAELAALATELGLAPPTLAEVLAVPGVVAEATADSADLVEPTGRALATALDELCAHRAAEGAALVADLTARLATLRQLVDGLEAASIEAGPIVAARLRDRLDKLIERGRDGVTPERLAQEVAILVERADVTEEMVRARTHVDAVATTLAAPSASVGRRLDFLLQELGREINTTGAKSATAAISSLVVQAKAELEKMREQVQNLE